MTGRLLRRSATTLTNDSNISGKVKMIKVSAVCVCAVSIAGPAPARWFAGWPVGNQESGVVVERAEEWAIKSPRRGCEEGLISEFVLKTVHRRGLVWCSVPVFGVGGKCFFPTNLYESQHCLSSQRQPEQLHSSLFFGPVHSHQSSEEIPGGSPLRFMSVPIQRDDRVEFKH